MTHIRFEWDSSKAESNKTKNRVQKRFHEIFGIRILVVCYCYREDESTIRIISARKATKKETHYYGGDRQ